jgi:endonuclease YncB( thermonuclease family)
MMKSLIYISALIFSSALYGHGGSLDSYGCHKNRKEGVYQCHEGAYAGKSYASKVAMLKSIGATTGNSANKQGNQSALINEITGKVVSIADGDTITILMDNTQYKIRLAEIDTPERAQPYGSKSKEILSAIVFGKEVTARVQDKDRYGRYVARIYQGTTDVNREMIRLGAAWVYRQYLTDESLLDVENEAKAENRGLWSLPESQKIPPWEWRRN